MVSSERELLLGHGFESWLLVGKVFVSVFCVLGVEVFSLRLLLFCSFVVLCFVCCSECWRHKEYMQCFKTNIKSVLNACKAVLSA